MVIDNVNYIRFFVLFQNFAAKVYKICGNNASKRVN
jgi:hypothetical protein